jgi:hypothetical protein
MTTQIEWTTEMIKDVAIALSTTLERVPAESIANTQIAENWNKARHWLEQVTRIQEEGGDENALNSIPPFPLTGQQLRALTASIDRIAQARAAASADKVGTTSAHLHGSFAQALGSSRVLVGMLSASLAASVVSLILLRDAHTWGVVSLSVSIVLALTTIIEWLRHYQDLTAHRMLLHDAHPLPGI